MVYTDKKYIELCKKMLPKNNGNISKYLTKSERLELENLILSEIRATMTHSNRTKVVDERLLTLKQIKLLLLKVAARQNKKALAKKRSKYEE